MQRALKIFLRVEAWLIKKGNSFAKNVLLCGITKVKMRHDIPVSTWFEVVYMIFKSTCFHLVMG